MTNNNWMNMLAKLKLEMQKGCLEEENESSLGKQSVGLHAIILDCHLCWLMCQFGWREKKITIYV